MLTRRGKILVALVATAVMGVALLKAAVLLYERHLLLFPTREYNATPAAIGLTSVAADLVAADGVRLKCWWIPADSATAAVIVCHGNGGNIGDRLHLALGFKRLGWSTLLVGYRGYGASAGTAELAGMCRDAEAAWDWTIGQGFPPDRIVIYGESLGGGIAARLADLHPDCRGLVLDGTFTSMGDMCRHLLAGLPAGWLLTTNLDIRRQLSASRVPVIIFHGESDPVIPFAMGGENYAAAAGRKRFVPVAGGSHCDLPIRLGRAYFDAIGEFHGDTPTAQR